MKYYILLGVLVLGFGIGFGVRQAFIVSPDDLEATRAAYESRIEALEGQQKTALSSADQHRARADNLQEQLDDTADNLAVPERIEVPVEVTKEVPTVPAEMEESYRKLQLFAKEVSEQNDKLREIITEHEKRETTYKDLVDELRAESADLRKSLQAAIDRASLAEARVKEWEKASLGDVVSITFPSCSYNAWVFTDGFGPPTDGSRLGCGVSIGVNLTGVLGRLLWR